MLKNSILITICILCLSSTMNGEDTLITVQSKRKPADSWKNNETRTLSALEGYDKTRTDTEYSPYGGLLRSKHEATGYFYTKKIKERWFFVDPDGYLFFNKGIASTRISRGEPYESAFSEIFDSEQDWANKTSSLFRKYGYNGTGGFSDDNTMQSADEPLVFSPILKMLKSYGNTEKGTTPVRWKNDVIPVFDPGLRTHFENEAKNFISQDLIDNPNLLGYMTDNELGFYHAELKNYLTMESTNPNYIGAWKWIRDRKGENVSVGDVTSQDEQEFMGYIADIYFEMTVDVIKKIDPNHLVMGSRLHGAGKNNEYIIKAAAKHLDVVSINYYNSWGPDLTNNWEQWMDRPFIITEWYVKGQDVADSDPAFTNESGAGWIVPSQEDRGHFYQNFTLGLIESPLCVGWHWFTYIDSAPSNKGMLSRQYENYHPLMDAMKEINTRIYDLIEFFDNTSLSTK